MRTPDLFQAVNLRHDLAPEVKDDPGSFYNKPPAIRDSFVHKEQI